MKVSPLTKILFFLNPETAHYTGMFLWKVLVLLSFGLIKKLTSPPENEALALSLCGKSLKHPVGLAAGFDKDGRFLKELEACSFSALEIGTVCPLAQPGNPKPRLFRIPEKLAIINRMGFNNEGAAKAKERLSSFDTDLLLGINIGKNKITALENAADDYQKALESLWTEGDYFTVNVSSPNTPGLRELQGGKYISELLSRVAETNKKCALENSAEEKPLFIKISPDLDISSLKELLNSAIENNFYGVIATNTTIKRELALKDPESLGAGGLSGKPLFNASLATIKEIKKHSGDKLKIIAVGGIFTGSDAFEMLKAGADMIQVWTAFVYRGPFLIKKICHELIAEMKLNKISSIHEIRKNS